MSDMFYNVYKFNHDLSSWDVLKVIDMGKMIHSVSSFNHDLSY